MAIYFLVWILVVLILCFILSLIVYVCASIYILSTPINSIILRKSFDHDMTYPETTLGDVLDVYKQYYKIATKEDFKKD
jgi:hypothetical protein